MKCTCPEWDQDPINYLGAYICVGCGKPIKDNKMSIKLGQKVRDTVSGLVGIAICRAEWLHGCIRIVVQPGVDKDGKVPDSCSVDEPQLEIIDNGLLIKEPEKRKFGPRPDVNQKETPRR